MFVRVQGLYTEQFGERGMTTSRGELMDLDFDDTVVRELELYARRVTRALGLSGDSSCLQGEQPASVYLALDGVLPDFPDRDVALLWDENRGWAAAVEADGQDPVVVARFGAEVRPAPGDVANWVDGLLEDVEVPQSRIA